MIGFILAAALLGCVQKNVVPPTARDPDNKPSMPSLGTFDRNKPLAHVFGPSKEFDGNTLGDLGRSGLFGVHSPKLNQIALLKNSDESFAVRIQLLEKAKKSIRIQALIFSGDESGLYISEILNRKRVAGL